MLAELKNALLNFDEAVDGAFEGKGLYDEADIRKFIETTFSQFEERADNWLLVTAESVPLKVPVLIIDMSGDRIVKQAEFRRDPYDYNDPTPLDEIPLQCIGTDHCPVFYTHWQPMLARPFGV